MSPAAAPKRAGKARLITSIISGIIVVVVAVIGYLGSRSEPNHAKVGSCLNGDVMTSVVAQDASDTKIVDCASEDATYRVVGKVDNKSESDFKNDDSLCDAYPDATAELWGSDNGDKDHGYVLCLAELHPSETG